jgi:hypothetical protein
VQTSLFSKEQADREQVEKEAKAAKMEKQALNFNKELEVVKIATFKAERNKMIDTDLDFLKELNSALKEENTFLKSKKKMNQSLMRGQLLDVL